jgi:hypothetical protein
VLRKHVILFMLYTYVFLFISVCLVECESLQTAVWIPVKFDIGKFYKKKNLSYIPILLKIRQDEICGFSCSFRAYLTKYLTGRLDKNYREKQNTFHIHYSIVSNSYGYQQEDLNIPEMLIVHCLTHLLPY